MACGISYEILAIYVTRLLSVVGLAWLYCTIGELQPIEYLKSVFLEILNVTTWSVFQNKVTYITDENTKDLTRNISASIKAKIFLHDPSFVF